MHTQTLSIAEPSPACKAAASAERLTQVYATLKRVARKQLNRGHAPATLSPTALVHEAYLRVAEGGHLAVDSESHLISLCARTMRHVFVDYCRARAAAKRGNALAVDEPEADCPELADPAALLALDQALHDIEARDPRLARVIELRVFAGLEPPAIAEALGVDLRTVQRDWLRARVWLSGALG